MTRKTPLYGLPALDGIDKPKDYPQQSWDFALLMEAILANQGQPPLSSDLQSLIRRLTALEAPAVSGSVSRSTNALNIATGAWNNLFTSTSWTAEQPWQGIDFDGRITIKTAGWYVVSCGVKLDAAVNMLFGMRLNSTVTGSGEGMALAGSAGGTSGFTSGAAAKPMRLAVGDKIGLSVFTTAATGVSNTATERAMTFMSAQRIEPLR